MSAVHSFEAENGAEGFFSIGVGGYPEKHFEAANMETDVANLKRKVEAGADYVVTQMFFDNKAFYSFVERCRAAGITVPIIPGLKPLSTLKQIQQLPETFSIDIPVELTKEVSAHEENVYQIFLLLPQKCRPGLGSSTSITFGKRSWSFLPDCLAQFTP